jgi:predicted house-cleaning noncanonical NTP pyrophosphatase (MazG superfamily)
MSEKFVTPGPLPNEYERELLTILIEECAEIQQRATKALRFGLDEIQPGQPFTNKYRLGSEVGDLMEVVQRCLAATVLRETAIEEGRVHKKKQLDKYMQTEKPVLTS